MCRQTKASENETTLHIWRITADRPPGPVAALWLHGEMAASARAMAGRPLAITLTFQSNLDLVRSNRASAYPRPGGMTVPGRVASLINYGR